MEKIRIGVIGAGGIAAKLHFPELQELADRCEVVVISGRKEARLRLLCERFGITTYTQDYEAVILDPKVDAVIIATPHPQHVSWGIRALEAGKHVLMQKPLCGDMREADAFVATVEKSDRTVLCMPHFSPVIYALRAAIANGSIGRVSGARARTSHGGPEVYYREVHEIFGETQGGEADLWFFDKNRADVGALFDMGVYAVAHLVALLGTVKRVTAVVGTFDKPTELEDTATLILQMASGAIAVAETSWCDAARTWELSVHGTAGKFVAPGQNDAPATRFTPVSYTSDHDPITAEPVMGDASVGNLHTHFFNCIERGIQPPVSNAYAARHVTEVLLAGLESGRTGCAVDIRSSAEA
ncbi:MAG: Gfo/Idh/MocA family oxidoreductase [Abitibacteriaceae bacterium]|nr:Gfo/Idh/MocA family oxidoreductase [Abditibacteriaceae bacterium]MBV9866187.1 Gfo/Idh/MocA family oxidoreductase [Abditibacteriaceae bacterium]